LSEAQARQQAAAGARARDEAQRRAELEVITERENGMALAALLLVAALAAGGAAFLFEQRGDRSKVKIAGGISAALFVGAVVVWLLRPPLDSIDERAAAALAEDEDRPAPADEGSNAGAMVCVFDPDRSRATISEVADVPLDWSAEGCVNGRTQYGLSGDGWSRVLVPNDEATVSVNRYDPKTRTYRVERFLMSLEAMTAAREARSKLKTPSCSAGEQAAREFGAGMETIKALLPPQPNERLVYRCQKR